MKVEEFFENAKEICNVYNWKCEQCPIGEYCSDGIFASNLKERTNMIQSVEKSYKDLMEVRIDKDFSEGFMHDIADLLEG